MLCDFPLNLKAIENSQAPEWTLSEEVTLRCRATCPMS